MNRLVFVIWCGWIALIVMALTYGCATPPEKVDAMTAAMQRNARLCEKYGGIKRIDVESTYADVRCRDGHGFRVWYYK